MAVLEKVGRFFAAIVGVVMIAISALLAFSVTCFSFLVIIGDAGPNPDFVRRFDLMIFALVASGAAAVAAAVSMTYFLVTRKSRRRGITRKP